MEAKDLSNEQLMINYINSKMMADRYYKEQKDLEEEMKRRFNQKIEEARRGKFGD